eukprot:m.188806 g.188806  ORF g.188806 m.188806 type:complete len:134 (+) comp24837_c0_seq2:3541-3942(+)
MRGDCLNVGDPITVLAHCWAAMNARDEIVHELWPQGLSSVRRSQQSSVEDPLWETPQDVHSITSSTFPLISRGTLAVLVLLFVGSMKGSLVCRSLDGVVIELIDMWCHPMAPHGDVLSRSITPYFSEVQGFMG